MELITNEQQQDMAQRLAHYESLIKKGMTTFIEVGNALAAIQQQDLYKKVLGYKTFEAYCKERWEMARRTAYQFIDAAEVVENVRNCAHISPTAESQVRPLVTLSAQEQTVIWCAAVDKALILGKSSVTAALVEEAIREYRSVNEAIASSYEDEDSEDESNPFDPEIIETDGVQSEEMAITPLDPTPESEPLVMQIVEPQVSQTTKAQKFNLTNDNVGWAMWTWNPVTGCLHTCSYCYARDIALRFTSAFPTGFEPTFHPDRLAAPRNTKVPEEAQTNIQAKNVFVCSMADLWGKWVPREWIEAVLQEVRNAPQWNFLFLTKFPARYEEFAGEIPDNAWIGTTVDRQHAVARAEKAFERVRKAGHNGIRWLSCEPLLEELTFSSLEMFDWVVVGGASKSSQTPVFLPPVKWWVHLLMQARSAGAKFYMKTNLIVPNYYQGAISEQIQEYPWQTQEMPPVQSPSAFFNK